MKRIVVIAAALLLGWLATGLYVIRGNEQGVVRRLGRVVTIGGRPALRGSGLHLDLPWPLARIDRVNLNEIRTLTLGASSSAPAGASVLDEQDAARRLSLVTGDRNVLNVKVDMQYRVAGEQVGDYLYAAADGESRLKLLVQSVLVELVTGSGVDYVQTLGRSELQELISERVRRLAVQQRLGVEIESVSLDDVGPPLRVKAAFLDVNDARADREKYVNAALTWEDQRVQEARGEARRVLDEAHAERQQTIASARARAESFERLIDHIRREAQSGSASYADVRRMTLQRRFLDDLQAILRRVATKVFVDSDEPGDVTIFGETE